MKRHNYISWFACIFGLSIFAHTQAIPTATRSGLGTVQIGVNGSYIHQASNLGTAAGVGVYGTYDITRHFGVEGDVHLNVSTSGVYKEKSYLIGPRYVFHKNRFHPYAKVLFGIGTLTNPDTNFRLKYGVYDFGGGLDVKATRRINIRAIDFEYQKWPSFNPSGLSPYLITAGVAYNFR